jgi:hypothetical protein
MADMVPILQAFGQQGQSSFAQPDQTNLLGQANTALQNPLLLQYISALGGSMGGTVAKGLDATNQQNIKAQSYMKMLQKMMAGGAKVGMDAESTTIKMPTKDAHTIMGVQGDEGTGQAGGFGNDRSFTGGGTSSTPQPKDPASVMGAVLGGNVNPTPSPLGNFSASDLAGLTPQDIASALTGKFTQEKITQEGVNSQFDNAYKLAQINRMNQPTEEKDTASIKDYEFAVKGGYKGSYPEWRMELAKMGGTHINIGEKVEEKKAMNKLEGQLYFGKGEHVKELAARKKSEDYQNTMFRLKMQDPVKADSFESEDTVKFIEDRITSMGGKRVENTVFDEDGKTMVWTVKWPSGDTEKIRYKIKD